MENGNSKFIKASPTKAFFISMLVKDIPLTRVILDLVDNAIDGARRLRPKSDFSGLSVRAEISPDKFVISDNCGGIPVNIARNYAFRFGRSSDTPSTEGSIGQFGVGMKRALFKIGSAFRIESITASSRFVVEVDVAEWAAKEEAEWTFDFSLLEEDVSFPVEQQGTNITVSPLHSTVASEFSLDTFEIRLRGEMEAAVQQMMQQELAVTLNKVPLKYSPSQMFNSDEIQSAYRELLFEEKGQKTVTAKIYSGVSESIPSKAGWYVFCNGRMVLEADRTIVTGWGEKEDTSIPRIHNQFSRFRGFVYFDCDDASRLPWNTTKTGVDVDSPVYRATRQEMLLLMRPVIDFLNKLKEEEQLEQKPLALAIENASLVEVVKLSKSDYFISPSPVRKPSKPPTKIQYSRPPQQIEKAKEVLGVKQLREVGELTFDYFYERECED